MPPGLSSLRVLMLDGNKHLRQVLAPIIAGAGIRNLDFSIDYSSATGPLQKVNPHLIFIDLDVASGDALDFVRTTRKEGGVWNYRAPIIVLATKPDRDMICAARDAGVNEIVVKPMTTAAVMERLTRVILKPRNFILSPTYRGPDRRRRDDPAFRGPYRRRVEGAPELVQ